MSLFINGKEIDNFHFVGIMGIGMSAIAQFLAKDCTVGGSDRSRGENIDDENILKNQNISLFLQDGSGISPKTQAVVVSTAIESDNPDIKKANELNIKILHRSEVLAAIVKSRRAISVTGTSGKSSVSAMIFHILDFGRLNPSFIGGANLHSLRSPSDCQFDRATNYANATKTLGNAFRGEGDILVFEADESDGTVARYFPEISLLLNVSRDHKEIDEVVSLMRTASNQSKKTIFNKDDKHFEGFSGKTFGMSETADYFPIRYSCGEESSTFTTKNGSTFVINFTGEHTIKNALASIAACAEFGVSEQVCAQALLSYTGVARRFDKYKASKNIIVIDDYAHNPDKISAAIMAAKKRNTRLFVIFQPHGFGPLKFMFDELSQMFEQFIKEDDKLYLLPCFYAGGVADRSLDSDKLSKHLSDKTGKKESFSFIENREKLTEILTTDIKENDTVLICGARDNSLATFAADLAKHFTKNI